ncbi:NAD(P)/FAD-dependent oxidoreductase [Miltoncostaea oceani]|uniref:NAD(P)/FAD-dependent oxidoreductase n=1 Tax=Miltoncostaea oceani TaxID=2843216 RepID=UPI001C3E6FD6|nr:FAD-binding oxidoreductase [Miltoncostaea oceani]
MIAAERSPDDRRRPSPHSRPGRGPPVTLSAPRVVVCGAGVIGAAVAWALARHGVPAVIVDRGGPAAAASGSASGFLAADWNAGNPLDAMSRASFALHRELADELGAERIGYRPLEVISAATAEEGDLERYRRLPTPDWLDGRVVAHEVIGTTATAAQVDPRRFTTALVDDAVAAGARFVSGVVDGLDLAPDGTVRGVRIDGAVEPCDVVVLALGPWTDRAQRWLALPQVFGTRMASMLLAADAPAQAVFSEYAAPGGGGMQFRIYPRPGGTVYITGRQEHGTLPDDPAAIAPSEDSIAELRRVAAVHSSRLAAAGELARSACHRPLTVDGLPLIGPVPGASGAFLATAHASWGLLHAPATGRMVAEMVLDGGSTSLDAAPFAVGRLPAGRR